MNNPPPVRIGVLGLTHDHIWDNLADLKNSQRGQLIAVADPNEPLTERARQEYGCAVYASANSLLQNESLDAVYIYGDNAGGEQLAIAAAQHGLHSIVEKPLAASLAGARRMVKAARSANTRLMVNWPFAWWPQLQQALSMAQAGEIGAVWQVKYRAAHAGPRELGCSDFFCDWLFDAERNGAGALMDYCCYGAVLSQYLLGRPQSVVAASGHLTKTELPVEDNGVVIMSYPRAISISEGSWSHIGKLGNYTTMIFGSEGTLMVEPRDNGRLLKATEQEPAGVEIPCSAQHGPNATEHLLDCLLEDSPLYGLVGAEAALGTQEILQAALQSVTEQRSIVL